MDIHHPETIPSDSHHICEICARLFSTDATLRHHQYRCHNSEKIINYYHVCRVCKLEISQDEDLVEEDEAIKDQVSKTGDGVALDALAQKQKEINRPSYGAAMLRHFAAHHPHELLSCSHENCVEKFVLKRNRKRHVEREHAKIPSKG